MENSANVMNAFMAALIFEKSKVSFKDLFLDKNVYAGKDTSSSGMDGGEMAVAA